MPGELGLERGGLGTVGIPNVMGQCLDGLLADIREAFRRVVGNMRRWRPSGILALHVSMVYAVSMADYRLSLVPMSEAQLAPLHVQVHHAARLTIQAPSWFPTAMLLTPQAYGGRGFPKLSCRLGL